MVSVGSLSVLFAVLLSGVETALAFQLSRSFAKKESRPRCSKRRFMTSPSYYGDDLDDDEDDECHIDVDSLGDWKAFRRNLAVPPEVRGSNVSRENQELLKTQCESLAKEYALGVWAHTTPTPEVGGLVVRMPIEAEIYRNHRHSITGKKLRKKFKVDNTEPSVWYRKAQLLVEHEMMEIAEKAGDDGQIDASTLDDESAELLQLYLDNQETWQEVCLVLERDECTGTTTTLVLNRPMALKLTENLAQLVLHGIFRTEQKTKHEPKTDIIKFMLAFGQECAVYIGGPDDQDQPAEIIHGIADLPGAVEISPRSGIYVGGLEAAVDGVLKRKYKPMDFRFFVGRRSYDESALDVACLLGKYQPVAIARSLVLKQCISLPKPLWHEVLELCNGEMKEISHLELSKRDDLRFQIVDDDDEDLHDSEILDELSDLEKFDDDDDEYFVG